MNLWIARDFKRGLKEPCYFLFSAPPIQGRSVKKLRAEGFEYAPEPGYWYTSGRSFISELSDEYFRAIFTFTLEPGQVYHVTEIRGKLVQEEVPVP